MILTQPGIVWFFIFIFVIYLSVFLLCKLDEILFTDNAGQCQEGHWWSAHWKSQVRFWQSMSYPGLLLPWYLFLQQIRFLLYSSIQECYYLLLKFQLIMQFQDLICPIPIRRTYLTFSQYFFPKYMIAKF